MRLLILGVCAVLSVATTLQAATVGIPESGVSFEAPAGFTLMSKEEIATKYPTARPPSFVVGNERRSTTVAFDLKLEPVTPDKLPQLKTSFETLFGRVVPGLAWKRRDMIELDGRKWI